MTPFIDVMLVLLIIFMIAAPLATVDVAVDLPGSTAAPQPRPADPVYLTVREDLTPRARRGAGGARRRSAPALDALAGGRQGDAGLPAAPTARSTTAT